MNPNIQVLAQYLRLPRWTRYVAAPLLTYKYYCGARSVNRSPIMSLYQGAKLSLALASIPQVRDPETTPYIDNSTD